MGGGKEPPEFLMGCSRPSSKNCQANICFAIFLVRIFLGGGTSFTDKVTEARCDQHNTEQEKSPIPVLALLTTFFL